MKNLRFSYSDFFINPLGEMCLIVDVDAERMCALSIEGFYTMPCGDLDTIEGRFLYYPHTGTY